MDQAFEFIFASAGAVQPSGLLQILPFAIILGIFYFLILMPMKKPQGQVLTPDQQRVNRSLRACLAEFLLRRQPSMRVTTVKHDSYDFG